VDFVMQASELTAATVTPQHLLLNRNDLLAGGLRPHNYCLPVLKRERHQKAIQQAVLAGHPRFFLGTDSAPHARHKKESACGCAGCYSAPAALPLYAGFFEQHGALDKLEAFASHFGPSFYRLPRNSDTITLMRKPWVVPDVIHTNDVIHADEKDFIPFAAGQALNWQVATSS
jgi:dihydroorotase